MTANEDFFKQTRRAQSALKHAILKKYLATFAGATGTRSPNNRVGYLDGYAGPGSYSDDVTGISTDGSPRLALTIAENQLSVPRRLECVFIEKDNKYFDSLSELASSAKTPAVALHGDVALHLDVAIERFKGIPALVFLDPFGAAIDNDQAIKSILGREGDQPTELLLNFSMDAVRRMGGRLRKPESDDEKGREATLIRMDRWLGGDWWRAYFQDPALDDQPDPIDFATSRVAKEYMRRVNETAGCGSFGVAIRRQAGHKPIFVLTLFHPRPLAAFKFNEAVSLAQEEWRERMWELDIDAAAREDAEAAAGHTLTRASEVQAAADADRAQFKIDTITEIKTAITKALELRESVSVQYEFSKVFGSAIGEGRTLHLRAAWNELAQEGIAVPMAKGEKLYKAVIRRASSSTNVQFR